MKTKAENTNTTLPAAATDLAQESFVSATEGARIDVSIPRAAEAVTQSLISTDREYRVAIAQITTDPGEISRNTGKIIDCIREARQRGAQLVVFPELAIPGYCSMDLLFDRDYIVDNINALQKIREESKGITVIVGFVDTDVTKLRPGNRPTLYNSAAIIHDGVIVAVQDKTLLPNYDIFFEDRYFAPPRERKVVDVGGIKIGTEICEDLWSNGYSVDPTSELAHQGADLVVNLSASPFHLGKLPVRESLISSTAQKNKVPFVYANLVGSFDGYEGEVVFDGRSIVMAANGKLAALGKGFKENLLIVDVFNPQEMALPEVRQVEELHDALVLGIKDYFRRVGNSRKANFERAYIGLSGGIDSAVVAALAVEALGPDKVVGITMPSRFSSNETISDAEITAQKLGIALKTIPIEKEFKACLETVRADPEVANLPDDVAEENIQARLRMVNLMYFANKTKGLVLNTGNKTELALDNCTIYGDMVGGFSVLGDVDKDRVYDLAYYINERNRREVIPLTTIVRPPSAELKPGQTDDMVMGAMPQIIAPMVRAIVEDELTLREAKVRFDPEFSSELIHNSFRKIDRSEWKRRQAAPAIRVTPHSFGNGRRLPMAHGYYSNQTEK